uniref:Translation initiation factor IF-3 n=1 Tax=Leptocylindrus danicus TaxID=163516 RepID=A0A7S2KJ44_9STRA|mmetsp:Transcript_23345/g.35038  ORF Transcript_23345/g.35038 Transcript_23345/m.35038 type:complete len:313 (+) Transcript_23345:48-986(+)
MKISLTTALLILLSGNNTYGFSPIAFQRTSTCKTTTSTELKMVRRGMRRGQPRVIEVKPPMNGELPNTELRVVTPNPKGKDDPLGVMSRDSAIQLAQEMGGLDLIMINPNSDPPVCKIVDYSKYRFEKEKKAKELKKNSKATEVKEVKMSYKIDVHDYEVRRKAANKFILQGNRVKCSIMFKGREIQHDKLGFELLDKLAADLEDVCVMEGRPKRDGRNLSCVITPKPEVVKKINEKKRAVEKEKRRSKEKSKKEYEEKMAAKAEQGNSKSNSESKSNPLPFELKEDDDNDDPLKDLDDLLGGDDLTDDLFK